MVETVFERTNEKLPSEERVRRDGPKILLDAPPTPPALASHVLHVYSILL